jgi:hypothetical protein
MNKPTEFSTEDLMFVQELLSLAKTAEGIRIMQTSPHLVGKVVELNKKYGESLVHTTIDRLKNHEQIHTWVQTIQEVQT